VFWVPVVQWLLSIKGQAGLRSGSTAIVPRNSRQLTGGIRAP